jgi:membrane-bound lytic murein transglycosylase D
MADIMTRMLHKFVAVSCLLWGSFAQGMQFPKTMNEQVQAQLSHFNDTTAGREKIRQAMSRMKRHAIILDAAIEQHGLPRELLAIPIVESEYRNLPQTRQQIYGAGIWMFVKGTACSLGLKVGPKRDQRLNIALATDAALTLLKTHYEEFGDWNLALLAYNAGEGTVRRGIKATGSRDAWQLVAAGHSNDPHYLAKVHAASIILSGVTAKSLH